MKRKPGFELRNICGEKAIMAVGLKNIDFGRLISVNESAAYLWEAVGDTDFDAGTLAGLLCQEYDVLPEVAQKDAAAILQQWQECDLIE